ncbi:hypothetical protein BX666DRAFT_1840984, partial [Dichotomocladium elegans]
FVMSSWSAPHTQFHEPSVEKGFRGLLGKHGFEVFLIDERKASRYCRTRLNKILSTYKRVQN